MEIFIEILLKFLSNKKIPLYIKAGCVLAPFFFLLFSVPVFLSWKAQSLTGQKESIRQEKKEKPKASPRKNKEENRLVCLYFVDALDQNCKIEPDEVLLDSRYQVQANQAIKLKPGGRYSIQAKAMGYAPAEKEIVVPGGGMEPITIRIFMQDIRSVKSIHEITGDFAPGVRLKPDVFTMNDIPVNEDSVIKPGTYTLSIQKEGYFPILKNIIIHPDPKAFCLKETLISKPRKIQIFLKRALDNKSIEPDFIKIGEQDIRSGQEVKPGQHLLRFGKKGYPEFAANIILEPSSMPYLLEHVLDSPPIRIQQEITSSLDNSPLIPDLITLDGKPVLDGSAFSPGKYHLKIEKMGFLPVNKEILIESEKPLYVIQESLLCFPREIEPCILGDFPPGERIEAELIHLNGKDVRENTFAPGKYQLDIQQPGYIPLSETLCLTPGDGPFYLEKILISKPRILQEKITYDVPGKDMQSKPYKITLAPLGKPEQEKQYKQGDMVKPGSYMVRIVQYAYEPIAIKKHVWPSEDPWTLEDRLIAKKLPLNIHVTYDIEPVDKSEACGVSLLEKSTNISHMVQDGDLIKPGKYFLNIERAGYDFSEKQEMEIEPSEKPYTVHKKLFAKPRRISFSYYDGVSTFLGLPAPVENILVQGKPLNFADTFPVGMEMDIEIHCKGYEILKIKVKIPPGEGNHTILITKFQKK